MASLFFSITIENNHPRRPLVAPNPILSRLTNKRLAKNEAPNTQTPNHILTTLPDKYLLLWVPVDPLQATVLPPSCPEPKSRCHHLCLSFYLLELKQAAQGRNP